MTRASATLPRAAASSGRLRGVLRDAGAGGRPDVDAVGESLAPGHDADARAIVVPIGDPVGLAISDRIRFPVALS